MAASRGGRGGERGGGGWSGGGGGGGRVLYGVEEGRGRGTVRAAWSKRGRTGLEAKMVAARSSIVVSDLDRKDRYRIRCLFVSVFPDPDSPDTTNDCDSLVFTRVLYDSSAIEYTLGSTDTEPRILPT